MLRPKLNALIPLVIALAVTASCATTGPNASSNQAGNAYNNFLVLAIADNYTNRAHYERTVVSGLKAQGATATAYYSAAGGNTPVDREAVLQVLGEGNYDALLVTRVLNASSKAKIKSGSAAAKATRRDDKVIDFFRYDYEELDEPGTLQLRTDATFGVELYRTADEQLVWSTEIENSGADNIGEVIDEVAENVVKRLRHDKRIAR